MPLPLVGRYHYPGWAGSSHTVLTYRLIRGVLTAMLVTEQYGRGKVDHKVGVGSAPVGWPAETAWPGNEYE